MRPIAQVDSARASGGGIWARKMTRARDMTDVDAVGLLCPLPVLRARKVLIGLRPGDVVRLLADDPAAIVDIPHFCDAAGHELLSMQDVPEGQEYLIRRGAYGGQR